jgi:threonine dehydratase
LIPDELSIKIIEKVYQQIKPYINTTPLIKANDFIDDTFNSNIYLKYECFQKSGSFKARGAINNILSSSEKDLENGITAVSAGNHAIAASYAANIFNLKNKIFLYKSANKYRVQACKNYNANITFTVAEKAFDEVKDAEKQGYKFVHPFDGAHTLQGSATLGLEIIDQINEMDTKIDNVLISVGGGGLISGVGAVLKQFFPNINIIGIEPDEAKGITDSLKSNQPLQKVYINSIADSLCAPIHMPYSFSIAKQVIDEMFNITDKDMSEAMLFAYNQLKLFFRTSVRCWFCSFEEVSK